MAAGAGVERVARVPGVRRPRRGPRAARRHDGADRAARRDALPDGGSAAALLLHRPRLPRRAPAPRARCASSSRPGSSSSARPAPAGTAEALTVLCGALDAVGLAGYRVGLGDASLYPKLMAAFDVPEEARRRLLHELGTKDLVGLEHEVHELGLPDEAAELLVRVPQLRGGADVLGAESGRGRRRGRRPPRRARPARARASPSASSSTSGSPAGWATTRAPSSTSTTRRSARRSAAAGATTTCSAASAARCPPSASRSASTACTPRCRARSMPGCEPLRPDDRRPARRAAARDPRPARPHRRRHGGGARERPQAAVRRRRASSRCARATCRPTSRPAPPTSGSPARTS